jgi:hydroxymethylpyrimidine pyrophosphatase-like HAD family hydrolase
MKDLLDKFSFDRNDKYFLIFDIDGTLRPDTPESLDHRHPKIAADAALRLGVLNLLDNVDIIVLTARSHIDVLRANLPKNIRKYCAFGKVILDGEIIRYAREEFHTLYDETLMFKGLLMDIFGEDLSEKIDFLLTPGDFSIFFHEENYLKTKKIILEKINSLLENSKRWLIWDFAKEIILKDTKNHYDKGNAIRDILNTLDLSTPTRIYMFGDSPADYMAMEGLRNYQREHPNKRLKVSNICVGNQISDSEIIDFRFESYKDTLNFIERLHDKLTA